MAVETIPSRSTMDHDAELKRLAAEFDRDDVWSLVQELGLDEETIRDLQEKPGSSSITVETLMRTWMEQHSDGNDGLETLDILEDKLTKFKIQSTEADKDAEATSDDAKGGKKKGKKGFKRWGILVGLFFVSFIEVGSIRTLSLILDDLTRQFGVSTSYLAAIYGVVSGIYTILAFLNTHLLRWFSVRQLTMFGGAVSAAGLACASFTQTAPQVTGALIAYGAGYIFVILPTYTCLNSYFSDRFEIATGIMTSGGSTGVMIMPWIFENLLDMYGWRGAILLLGGVNAHFLVIGALLEPVRTKPLRTKKNSNGSKTLKDVDFQAHDNISFKPDSADVKESINPTIQSGQELEMVCLKDEGAVQRRSHAAESDVDATPDVATVTSKEPDDEVDTRNVGCLWKWLRKIIKFSGLRIFGERPLMIVVCFQILLFSLPYATWLLFTIPNAQAKGLSDFRSAQISLAGGIANFFGRFASGFVFSKNILPVEVWYLLANIVTAAAFFVNFFAEPFWFLTILAVLFGFMMGFNIPTIFVLVKNTAGKERYETGLAFLHLCYGLAFPLAGFVAGKIYDGTQSYNAAFCIMGGLALAAGVAVILPLLGSRFGKILKRCSCSCA
eukprot:XP_793638.3 PREDICTED: monocarboxylate transporter 7 [Strongylocentrotus purpuratus]